jgi:hypothetical protein
MEDLFNMKYRIFILLSILCGLFFLSCQAVSITEAEQLSLVSSEQIRTMSLDSFSALIRPVAVESKTSAA